MTTDSFLCLLDGVRSTRRGWQAKCPGHTDRHPSLSITEGDKGILLKCWTGCQPELICAALGLRMSDLFYEQTMDRRSWLHAKRQRARKQADRQELQDVIGLTIDCVREAERLIESARRIDISEWDGDRLHEELNLLADAHDIIERDSYGSSAGV